MMLSTYRAANECHPKTRRESLCILAEQSAGCRWLFGSQHPLSQCWSCAELALPANSALSYADVCDN